jgi:hypothetical protein
VAFKENEVTGFGHFLLNLDTNITLGRTRMGQCNPEFTETKPGKTGAIEAARGRTAGAIPRRNVLFGVTENVMNQWNSLVKGGFPIGCIGSNGLGCRAVFNDSFYWAMGLSKAKRDNAKRRQEHFSNHTLVGQLKFRFLKIEPFTKKSKQFTVFSALVTNK